MGKIFGWGVVWMLLLFAGGCSTGEERQLDEALKLAGDNRKELEKVLDYYAGDSLKLRAVRFLIRNMPGCYGFPESGLSGLASVYQAYDSVNRVFDYRICAEWGKEIDRLQERIPGIFSGCWVADLSAVSSSYLISETERSFDAWERNVYASQISFDDFLEYVLPYRRLNGLVADGIRDTFYYRHMGKYYASAGHSWKEDTDSLLYEYRSLVHSQFFGTRIPLVDAATFERLKRGLCIHRCWYNSFLLSALGMPVAIDFVPAWGNRNNSHTWNVLVMGDRSYAFEAFWDEDRWKYKRIYNNRTCDRLWGEFRLPKVYRYTYSNHPEGPVTDRDVDRADIPSLFRNMKKLDVSNEYFETQDVCIKLTEPAPEGARYAYLAVFGYQQWHPVQWGKIGNDGSVLFRNMGKDMVYLPVYYRQGVVVPAASPFRLEADGTVRILSDDGKRGKVGLRTLFGAPTHDRNLTYLHAFRGTSFVVMEDGNPQGKLCELTDSLGIGMNRFPVVSSASCRYVRMYLPADTLAAGEIVFYTADGRVPSVRVVSEGIPLSQSSEGIRNLTDGTEATCCRCRFPEGYVDFDLGESYRLTGVGFCPYLKSQIETGNHYELLYWDKGWKRHASREGTELGWLEFEGVPLHCLLMLKNTGWPGASAERTFTVTEEGISWE